MKRENCLQASSRAIAALLATAVIILAATSGSVALAHKGKLPSDALSLVRQAAALLAQDAKMAGEVRERLEAALQSKDLRGVELTRVRQAHDALAAGNVPAARRALAEAVVSQVASPAAQPGVLPGAGTAPMAQPAPAPGAPQAPPSPAADPMAAMKMAEPLLSTYSGTSGELIMLLVGLALVVVGFVALRRSR